MSNKKDMKKDLDNFIIKSLKNYCHVKDPSDELKAATGNDFTDIISIKSVLPDLVIYNQEFNKNKCFFIRFLHKYNPFPRKKYYIKKKNLKNNSLQNNEEIKNNSIENNVKDINENDNKIKEENTYERKNDNYIINDFIIKNREIYNNALFRKFIMNELIKNENKNEPNVKLDINEGPSKIEISFNNNKDKRNWEIINIYSNGIIYKFNINNYTII